MRGIGDDDDPVERFLKGAFGGLPLGLPAFQRGEDPVVIDHHAADIHRYDGLGPLVDRRGDRVVVDLVAARAAVDHPDGGADMVYDRRGRGIGVGRRDHLVAGTDAQDAEREFQRGGRRIEAHDIARGKPAIGGDVLFEKLGPRPGGDPAGTQRLDDFIYLRIGDIRRRERDADLQRGRCLFASFFTHGFPSRISPIVKLLLSGQQNNEYEKSFLLTAIRASG